eukprot:s1366_g22.t2
MSSAPPPAPWPWPCRLSQRPSYPPSGGYLPDHLRFPPRPVLVIIDFSSLSSLSRRYRYYAALNRDIYEHLTGYSETGYVASLQAASPEQPGHYSHWLIFSKPSQIVLWNNGRGGAGANDGIDIFQKVSLMIQAQLREAPTPVTTLH